MYHDVEMFNSSIIFLIGILISTQPTLNVANPLFLWKPAFKPVFDWLQFVPWLENA